MNYVAHIQLAHISRTSLLGNFMGDFVKGNTLLSLPEHLRKGVILHRKIDSFTDSHEHVLYLKGGFPKGIRRMAGVVLDIYFDHLLCKHWSVFTQHNFEQVLEEFYTELAQSEVHLPGRYSDVKQGLLAHRWLLSYQEFESCQGIFANIETRLSRPIIFANQAYKYLLSNQSDIEQRFLSFYPDLIEFVKASLND